MSLRIEEWDIDELCDANSEFPDDIYASLPALPPELQSLTVAFSYMSDTCAILKLGTLPPSLQYLEVSIPASDCWGLVDLHGLPESLRVLRIKEGMSPAKLVALPPRLQVLELDYIWNKQLPPLPQSLRKFSIGCRGYKLSLPDLPPALEDLSLQNYRGPLPELPSRLKRLGVHDCDVQFPPVLPASLHSVCSSFYDDSELQLPGFRHACRGLWVRIGEEGEASSERGFALAQQL
ncbi:hypothetical protein JKP88DRAFT_299055 [Tribonema minus]|uniref:Uncharacterized protein n=1 Tax=Tribonema minus TaxID=303371 RepID=A0A836CL54_9STRA|nr:hypothetical protein JKP88DRAFT_299055 [Tribonema minus]